jgi:hypothetical protein
MWPLVSMLMNYATQAAGAVGGAGGAGGAGGIGQLTNAMPSIQGAMGQSGPIAPTQAPFADFSNEGMGQGMPEQTQFANLGKKQQPQIGDEYKEVQPFAELDQPTQGVPQPLRKARNFNVKR